MFFVALTRWKELDIHLLNRSIKVYILTTVFCESNLSLAFIVISLHIIFSDTLTE
jgi:hypothetical protein